MMKRMKANNQFQRRKEVVVESLKLPKDTMLGDCMLSITGNSEIFVENYKGIINYSEEQILLQCKQNKIEITGKNLTIDYYTNDDMKIIGKIASIRYF